jgi:hypothetical protein
MQQLIEHIPYIDIANFDITKCGCIDENIAECVLCRKMISITKLHIRTCKNKFCKMPLCIEMKICILKKLLLHATNCTNTICFNNCIQMKKYLDIIKDIDIYTIELFNGEDSHILHKIKKVLLLHAKSCMVTSCNIVHCNTLKKTIYTTEESITCKKRKQNDAIQTQEVPRIYWKKAMIRE